MKTVPRQQPERVKEQIVEERGFKTIRLLEEMVAEFDYRPAACQQELPHDRRCAKHLWIDKGSSGSSRSTATSSTSPTIARPTAEEIVFSANDRCNQENLIAQLKSGVQALTTPVDNLVSNWAYMVMASLAWSLKAWSALLVPVSPRHAAKHASREANVAADGVRDVLRGNDPDAVPDRAERRPIDLPSAVMEPMAKGVLASGRAAAWLLPLLRQYEPEVGVRMPRERLGRYSAGLGMVKLRRNGPTTSTRDLIGTSRHSASVPSRYSLSHATRK